MRQSRAHSGVLDGAIFAHLHWAQLDWNVLFFRDQPDVTTKDRIAFTRQFGGLEIHPFLPDNGYTKIVVLDTASGGPARAEIWYTDVQFRE